MCELCNGTNVMTVDIGFGWVKQPCPKCGPVLDEVLQKRDQELEARIREAEIRLGLVEEAS
jgi:hypothetical protein